MLRKSIISSLDFLGIFACLCKMYNALFPSYIRVFNYHDVPRNEFDNFKLQVEYLISHLRPAHPSEIAKCLNGSMPAEPSFILTFDDGFESHATYVADYLKSKNITAIFFVPTNAPSVPAELQAKWALDHNVLKDGETAVINGRVFGSWHTWKVVAENHVVASHTQSHLRFTSAVDFEEARSQVEGSFKVLEEFLGVTNRIFCWVGGELTSYSAPVSYTHLTLPTNREV